MSSSVPTWEYNADTSLMTIYWRDGRTISAYQTFKFAFNQAHGLATVIDEIYKQGVEAGKQQMVQVVREALERS